MPKWWWKDQPTFELLVFKRVPPGWVFRSPIKWGPFGIGRARHFLLSDAEKDEISKIIYRLDRFIALTAVLVFLPAFLLLWSFRNVLFSAPLTSVSIFAACLLCLQYIWTLAYWLMLRSSLSTAQPTSVRITVYERFNAVAGAAPRGFLIFYLVFFVLLLVLFGHSALKPNVGILASLGGLSLAAGGLVVFVMLLLANRRAKQTTG